MRKIWTEKIDLRSGKRKGVDYGTWREKKDPSGSQRLREAIDMAIAQSDSYDDFLSIMRKSYQVKIGFSQNGILNIFHLKILKLRPDDTVEITFLENHTLSQVFKSAFH